MDLSNLIGWIGNFFFIHGVYELGNKKVIGFYTNIIGNILYVIFGILVGKSSIIVLSMFLIWLNIRGVLKWRKN